MSESIATHEPPAGGADFLVRVDLTEHGMPGRGEQLWVEQIDAQKFVVRSVPFFAYGIAPGDVVATSADFIVSGVIERGGAHVLRVAVPADHADSHHDRLHHALLKLELAHEWRATGYVAVELPSSDIPVALQSELDRLVVDANASFEVSTLPDTRG